jgi:hypothetical protein
LSFFHGLLADPEFVDAKLDTGLVERFFQRRPSPPEPEKRVLSAAAALAENLWNGSSIEDSPAARNGSNGRPSPWLLAGRDQLQR